MKLRGRQFDLYRAPHGIPEFNHRAPFAKHALFALLPGFGSPSLPGRDLGLARRPVAGFNLDSGDIRAAGSNTGDHFGLPILSLNNGLTTSGTQNERIEMTSYQRIEDAISSGPGFTFNLLINVFNLGPSEFGGFGRVLSKEISGATNLSFELVSKDDSAWRMERRTTGSPNSAERSTVGSVITLNRWAWITVRFGNTTDETSFRIWVDGAEPSYAAGTTGGGSIQTNDIAKPIAFGDRPSGGRESGVQLAYIDMLDFPVGGAEAAHIFKNRFDLIRPPSIPRVRVPVVGGSFQAAWARNANTVIGVL